MKISKIHQRFSERLNNPETLTNPEKYLGPNWENVLNFWIYLDTLSYLEKREIADRYWALDFNVRDSARNAAWNAADEVVGEEFNDSAWLAARDVTRWLDVFGCATYELIGSHKLLDQNKTLTFLPLCIKP